jgi:regulator of PEP synthase PpsR (kinase-PPPase family)
MEKHRKRPVFFISDRTGITAETLGHTLLTQFGSIEFEHSNFPFINTEAKAREAVDKINQSANRSNLIPLVFCTMIDDDAKAIIKESKGEVIDFFDTFIQPLETILGTESSHTSGLSHGISDDSRYMSRIEALNFTLANDDGVTTKHYPSSDIIVLGASRSGKTPTCLNLALQYGVRAANYPLSSEDILNGTLPDILKPYQSKLFGLTISANRLHRIREKRRPDSTYASLKQCQNEVRTIEALYQHEGIPYIDTSIVSVEEICTTIMETLRLERREIH